MTRKKSHVRPCPCDSGEIYEQCCYNKEFDWIQDEDGKIYWAVPVSNDVRERLKEQVDAFKAEHERDPEPDELLFGDLPPLEHLEHETVEAMKEAGIDPALIHAYVETGLLVTEENMDLIPEQDLEEWQSAVEEYREKNAEDHDTAQYPIGTMALNGPDEETTTKIVTGVVMKEGTEPIIDRWVGMDVSIDPNVARQVHAFFEAHSV